MGKLATLLHVANLPHHICEHLLGKRHTTTHRMIIGFFVMGTGVLITKSTVFVDGHTLHILIDIVGWGIHGLGFTPYLETVVRGFE